MSSMLLFFVLFSFNAIEPPSAPPTGVEATHFAPKEANAFFYLNTEATIAPSWKFLQKFGEEPFIKHTPELSRMLEGGLDTIKSGALEFGRVTGVDPFKDIHYISLWYKANSSTDAEKFDVLFVLKGNFPRDLVKKIPMPLETKEIEGVTILMDERHEMAFAQIDTEHLLAGSYALVEARVKKGYTPESSPQITHWQESMDRKPVIHLALSGSSTILDLARAEGVPTSALSLIKAFSSFDLSFRHDGIDIKGQLTYDDAYKRSSNFFLGFIDLCRSSQTFTRGLTRTSLALLDPSDEGLDAELRLLLKEREALQDFILRQTGEGNFDVKDRSNAKTRTLDLELRSKHLHEILQPVVLGGLFFFL